MAKEYKASCHHDLQIQLNGLAGIRVQGLVLHAARRAGVKVLCRDDITAAVCSEIVVAVSRFPGHALVESTAPCLNTWRAKKVNQKAMYDCDDPSFICKAGQLSSKKKVTLKRLVRHLKLVSDGDHDGAADGAEPGPSPLPGEDVERRGSGAEVESESPWAARALDQHPQDVVLADSDRANRAAAAIALQLPSVVRADAEERAVRVSSGQGIGGANAVPPQGVHEFGCGLLQLSEQIVCSVPGDSKIRG